jgi:NADPH:quinone reductase
MRLRGGVGGFAIQLAKAAKAFVIGTCSTANEKYVRELGADEVINYRSEDVYQRAKATSSQTRDQGMTVLIFTASVLRSS